GDSIPCRIEIRLPDTERSLDFANRESPFEYAQLPPYDEEIDSDVSIDEKKRQEAMRTRNYAVLDLIEAKKSFTTGEKSFGWSMLLPTSIRLLRRSIRAGGAFFGLKFWSSWSKLVRAVVAPPAPASAEADHVTLAPRAGYVTIPWTRRAFTHGPPTLRPPASPAASTVTAGPALGRSVARHHRLASSPTPRHLGLCLCLPAAHFFLPFTSTSSLELGATWRSAMRRDPIPIPIFHIPGRGEQTLFSHSKKNPTLFSHSLFSYGNQEVGIRTQIFNRN
ncbi:hypothetical protein THAOC_07724, partial [Thalassiosira oceanica]